MRIGIVTVSDSCFEKKRLDESGARARDILSGGHQVVRCQIVPDEREAILKLLLKMSDTLQLDLILTLGGTGLGPRDVTPEATTSVIERPAPGLPEYLRRETFRSNPHAAISRATAGLRGKTLILNLPGHPKAVSEQLALLSPLLPHIQEMITGGGHLPIASFSKDSVMKGRTG